MDRQELMGKLQDFKQVCLNRGYIDSVLYLTEAYPGLIPTSFVVNMVAKKAWLDTAVSRGMALDQLIDVLWETTTAKPREDIFTLSIYGEDERHLFEQLPTKEAA